MRSTWSCGLWWVWGPFSFVEPRFFLSSLSFTLSHFLSPSLLFPPPFPNWTTLTTPNTLFFFLYYSPCSSQIIFETCTLGHVTTLLKTLQWLSTALWVKVWSLTCRHRALTDMAFDFSLPLACIISLSPEGVAMLATFCIENRPLPPTGSSALVLHGAGLEAASCSLDFSSKAILKRSFLTDPSKESFSVTYSHYSITFPCLYLIYIYLFIWSFLH